VTVSVKHSQQVLPKRSTGKQSEKYCLYQQAGTGSGWSNPIPQKAKLAWGENSGLALFDFLTGLFDLQIGLNRSSRCLNLCWTDQI